MSILSRHILSQHVGPFFFGLGVILFVLVTNFVVDTLDLLLSKGVPLGTILEVVALSLGWMMALALPMAVLVATLMAFGSMAGDLEILAFRSAGVSPRRIVQPVLVAACVLSVLLLAYHEWVLPETNHRLANKLFEIHRKQPALGLEPGTFLTIFPRFSVLAETVDSRTSRLGEVTIYETMQQGGFRTIRAARGHAAWSEDASVLHLDLEQGEIHETSPQDPGHYTKVVFRELALRLSRPPEPGGGTPDRQRGDREMSVRMMRRESRTMRAAMATARLGTRDRIRGELRELAHPPAGESLRESPLSRHRVLLRQVRSDASGEAATERRLDRLLVETQKKFAISAAAIVFVLVGAPLVIRTSRGGMGIAIGISVLFFIAHYIFLLAGEHLADRGVVSPVVAMWGGDWVVGSLGLWCFWRTERDLPLLPAWPADLVHRARRRRRRADGTPGDGEGA
jgi:lipopolysaccharide export system permease protein